jgi:hypothetical protein
MKGEIEAEKLVRKLLIRGRFIEPLLLWQENLPNTELPL